MLAVRYEYSVGEEKVRTHEHVGVAQSNVCDSQVRIFDFFVIANFKAHDWDDIGLIDTPSYAVEMYPDALTPAALTSMPIFCAAVRLKTDVAAPVSNMARIFWPLT